MKTSKFLTDRVKHNFSNIKLSLLILPMFIIGSILTYVFSLEGGFTSNYVAFQKDVFYTINLKLSLFPKLQYNLTQLGDVIIVFPLVSFFLLYVPKFWRALLTSSVISLFVAAGLKKIFSVPRPAAIFDNDTFIILGKVLKSKTALPSGHSITTFIIISTLLFAFMPKKILHKILWIISILAIGFCIVFSRVAVGAHYPVDVIVGSLIGYILTIVGILLSEKYFNYLFKDTTKYYFSLIVVTIIWGGILVLKIVDEKLPIFYISLFSLLITIYLIIKQYLCSIKS